MPITKKEGIFTPTQILSCVLWLDGKDPAGTGTPPSSGATVSTWVDKSLSGKNGAGTGNPTYVSGGGINFDGSSYFINTSFAQDLSQRTIFIVMQETTHYDVHGILTLIPDPSDQADYQTTNGLSMETTNGFRIYGLGGSYQVDFGNATLLEKAIYEDRMNDTEGSVYLNGTNVSNPTAGYTAGTCSGYGVGTRWVNGALPSISLYGVIYEICFFNAPLATVDQQRIEGYLAQKWNLTGSLPAGHPGLTVTYYVAGGNSSTILKRQTITGTPYYKVFTPKSIAGCALWLDAADSSTVIGSAPITAWTDKSDAGRTVTITSGPTYGTTSQHGNNTLYFNNNTITSSLASAVGTGDFTLVAVWYQYSAGTNTVLSLGTVASSSQSLGFSGNKYNFYQYGDVNESAYSSTTPSWVVQIGTRIASVKKVYINGNVGSTPSSTSYNQAVTTITIGKGDNFAITGEIGEILVYTGTMSDASRQQLESYLTQKWGLTASLPAGHAFYTNPGGGPQLGIVKTTISMTQRVSPIVSAGLVYHLDAGNAASYPGSGSTWSDLASSGISMTLYGSPTYSSANGGYLSFVPSSSQYGSTSTSLAAASTWTIEAFIYYNGTNSSGLPCIFTDVYYGTTGTIQWALGSLNGGGSTTLQAGYFSGGWFTTPVQSPLTSGNWYHVVGTYDGTNIKLYINGSLNQTTASSTAPVRNAGGHRIMRRWDTADYWGGNLAVLRIYNSALSLTDVSQNYSAQKARFGLS